MILSAASPLGAVAWVWAQARAGRIAVLQFHGVPDREHPWVHTRPERFEEFMRYLYTNTYKVIALRDLARYVATVIHGMAVQAATDASRAGLRRIIQTAMQAWPD